MGVDDSEIEVSPAGLARLAALGPLFGRAFVNEPMMWWPMGEERDPERFTRCFSFFLELVLQLGLVWEAGAAIGAADWIPSGQFEGWDGHPWNQQRIRALTDDGGDRYDEFWRWIDSHSPQEPLLQLDSLSQWTCGPRAVGTGQPSSGTVGQGEKRRNRRVPLDGH